ncbi:MAG: cation:proton antiporter [Guyparkeria sp.]
MQTDTTGILLTLLLISVVAVVALRRINLPAILGYLAVGVLAGPHALGLVRDIHDIHLIAEFGVVFLLFMLGLEFSLPRLVSMRRAVVGMGGAQVMLTAVITGGAALMMGFSPAAAFTLAGVMTVSSTAIVIRQLGEQLEINSRHGNNAVGILLFQDLAVIPFLIIIPVLGVQGAADDAANLTLEITLTLGAGVLAAILLFFGGRWVLRPLFREIAKSRSAELFTLAVLLTVLGAGWLTNSAGLSWELGAFLAGIALSETQYKHQIEADIRPFRDVLLGLFFITIGMMLNVGGLAEIFHWVLVFLAILILAKTLIIFLIGRAMGEAPGVALRTGLVLAQGGEFGFAMLSIANPDLMTASERQIVLATVIFSMVLTPILVKYNGLIAKYLVPGYARGRREHAVEIRQDTSDLRDHVVVCGFGRVGQNVARLLSSEGIDYTAIEVDPDIVQQANEAGLRVYFGNSTHLDILQSAGLDRARALVLTHLDDASTIKTIEIVRGTNRDIPIIVRTRTDEHLDRIHDAGATEVVASVYEMSLALGGHVLRTLRVPISKILRQMEEIRREDYAPLRHTFHGDRARDENDFAPLAPRTLKNVTLVPGAKSVGQRLGDVLPRDGSVVVDAINRHGIRGESPDEGVVLQEDDVLTLYGAPEALDMAEECLLTGRPG